jgi:hypothetical protein
MAGRNIIWCQTSDANMFAKVQGKKYTHVILSALHMHCEGGKYAMYLNDTPVEKVGAPFWAVVSNLRKAGVTVTALLGGAGNGTWQCIKNNSTQALRVLNALTTAPYHLQGFDLDWEIGAPYDPKLMADLTNRLATARPGTVITHAPTTDLLDTYDASFWKAVGTNLAWINVQWYGDTDLVKDYFDFVTGKISRAAVDPSRVVAGATVMPQEGVGYVDLCQLMTLVTQIEKNLLPSGKQFGGVAGWEFTQTVGNPDPKVSNWDTCIAAALQGQTKCAACR